MSNDDFSYLAAVPSVENIAGRGAVVYTNAVSVFKEQEDTCAVPISDRHRYMPWGADNRMPYEILDLIERDETLSTCQMFNAEVCYGSGLVYNTERCGGNVKDEVEDFLLMNDLPSYFLGVCQDLKHFAFAVSVVILNRERTKILSVERKEACYCRFSEADGDGRIRYVYYANWRLSPGEKDIEVIPLLDMACPWRDFAGRMERKEKGCKFAVVTKIPAPDNTYYPIPYYASLFRGKWYDIKQLIGIAKEAKLRNSAPIKYHVEISDKYWVEIFKRERITDRQKMAERIVEEKRNIIDFLTGVENSGKAWFSTFYVSPTGEERSDVKINKVETEKEGGDWSTDIIEAINMICFTMRVHSNLVGSVPGKTQSNNSGSDKRELYTIAQALQKPYHDLMFTPHKIIIRFNGWKGCYPDVPFIQLTTLDENKDAKKITVNDPKIKKDDEDN